VAESGPILGIDEAGRGCVLGPLVVGAFVIPPDRTDEALKAAGATDSKKISPKKRLAARDALRSLGQPDVRAISAKAIDANNLNSLEEDAIIDLVRTWRPALVIMDALGHPRTLPALEERLRRAVSAYDLQPQWKIEPKADWNYPVVGAASIFAKTHRDETLHSLFAQYGPLGSGYPSDPKTRSWLKAWLDSGRDWPPFVRTRWGTIQDLNQQTLTP